MEHSFDPASVREQFPALAREVNGQRAIYTDGPAGSQVPRRVAAAISDYLFHHNANHGGAFITSRSSDALLLRVHQQAADFFGVSDPDTVLFGNNMTSLTFALSRALARTWQAGDEIILSRCDHDANVTPWVLAAQERGVTVRWIDVHAPTCTLDLQSYEKQVGPKTRLVAVGMASNAVGTVHPVEQIAKIAKQVGALVFLDAVHYAAHRCIEAAITGADFIVCSAYKFFGPHVGLMWGKRELWENITPYKLRPCTEALPGRWMTGTQNHEGIAGVGAALEYLASLGKADGTFREKIKSAYSLITQHESFLSKVFLEGIKKLPDFQLYGPVEMNDRVSTFGLVPRKISPRSCSERLAEEGIFTWAGNFYAMPLTETLGLEPEGMLRIGFLHYNTVEEVERVLQALARLQ